MADIEPSRRERKKEETRQRISQAAFDLFKSKGFETTTVDDITERADVGKGTLFNYFPRKEALLDEIHLMQIGEIEAVSERVLAGQGSALDMMLQATRATCEIYARDRELSRSVILNVLKSGPGSSPESLAMHERIQSVVRRYVEKGIARGELRSDLDIERATYVLRGNFFFTILMWLCCPEPPYDLRSEMEARLRLILRGMVAPGVVP